VDFTEIVEASKVITFARHGQSLLLARNPSRIGESSSPTVYFASTLGRREYFGVEEIQLYLRKYRLRVKGGKEYLVTRNTKTTQRSGSLWVGSGPLR